MLTAFRTFAKSWVAAVLIGLLVVSFAVFGIQDVFRNQVAGNSVISVGKRQVSPTEFRRQFDDEKAALEQQNQRPITIDELVANHIDARVLEALADREAFGAWMEKVGLRPADKLIFDQMAKVPAFLNPVTGLFDKKVYQQTLARNDLTPVMFEKQIHYDIANQHLGVGMAAGLLAPRAYTAMAALYMLESRDVAFFEVDPKSVPALAPPTDAQLSAFMTENSDRLMLPEFRILTVVRFSPTQLAGTLPVDEAELKKRYDFRKDTLSKPETRTVVQIPAKDQAAAAKIAAALAQGQAASAVAKAAGVDAITYADKPKSAIPDGKVAAAAFTMASGQVAAVSGDLGPQVIKVVSITPGHAVTLEEIRPQLEAEIRKDAAAEKVYAQTQAYDDAHQGGANIVQAAQKAGVAAQTIGPLAKTGQDTRGQPVAGLTQKLMDTAFNLPAGGESEIQEAGGGEYYAVKVDRIIAPTLPPLAEIRPQLTAVWMQREMMKRLEARAADLTARIGKGETLEAAAASVGSRVTRLTGLDRQGAGQISALSQDALAKVYSLKAGDLFTGNGTHFGLVVGKLEAVRSGAGPTMARMAEDARLQMTQTIFKEMGQSAHASARATLKVKIDTNRARVALGLEPIDPKAAGKAAKPEKAK